MLRPLAAGFALILLTTSLCAAVEFQTPNRVIISVRDQKLMLLQGNA